MPSPKTPSLLGTGAAQKKRQPEVAARAAEPLRWFEVLEDRQVPVPRGSTVLRAGKVINSGGFDLGLLHRAGVKLKEISAPQWYLDQQRLSEERHRELTAAGHELGEHPEPPEPSTPSLAETSVLNPA